jgi:hypothetical protein
MNEDLTPQEPGVIAGLDQSKLEALAEGAVGDLNDELVNLTDDELVQLAGIEEQGKARTVAMGAILREQEHRKADSLLTLSEPEESAASIGDRDSYANMRADEIDPSKLSGPVLTLSGWLLPAPKASPVA